MTRTKKENLRKSEQEERDIEAKKSAIKEGPIQRHTTDQDFEDILDVLFQTKP
jgi:hypothetical protein